MIGIRVDANEVVATGHIMRCMTIAKEIKKHGEAVLFFLADSYGCSFLEKENYDYVILYTDWEQPMEEVKIMAEELNKRKIAKMLFDSYYFTTEYFTNLKSLCNDKVSFTYIDDLFENIYPVERIINYNAYYSKFPYEESYQGKTELLLGPSFVPLREEFSGEIPPKKDIKLKEQYQVLLSCGGGDQLHVMKEILEKAMCFQKEDPVVSKLVWHVVAGAFTTDLKELAALSKSCSQIRLHENVREMAKLMDSCDFAISAAGTMLYELCARHCPTIFFITADNQRYDADFFGDEERMLNAGDIRENREESIKKIFESVERIITKPLLYDKMKDKLSKVTDGLGAEKIAVRILEEKQQTE